MQFTDIVKPTDATTTLATLFPYNYTSFGDKASLEFSSKQLIVYLLGSPTIVLGDLAMNTQKIRSQAGRTIYPDGATEVTFTLENPDEVRMPDVQVMGPSSVGMKFSISIICNHFISPYEIFYTDFNQL